MSIVFRLKSRLVIFNAVTSPIRKPSAAQSKNIVLNGWSADDAGGQVWIEEESLSWFLVGRKHELLPAYFRNEIVPLAPPTENSAQSSIDILRSFSSVDTTTNCGYERLVLSDIQIFQWDLAE